MAKLASLISILELVCAQAKLIFVPGLTWDIPELDETTFFETETRPRPGLVKISRPRRDREFCKMIFRDRDETETRNLDREIREIETETRVSSNSARTDNKPTSAEIL